LDCNEIEKYNIIVRNTQILLIKQYLIKNRLYTEKQIKYLIELLRQYMESKRIKVNFNSIITFIISASVAYILFIIKIQYDEVKSLKESFKLFSLIMLGTILIVLYLNYLKEIIIVTIKDIIYGDYSQAKELIGLLEEILLFIQ